MAGDVDDGLAYLPVAFGCFEIPDERAVELEGTDGKVGQIAQAGVARAEVIERKPDALVPQLLHDALDLLEGIDEHALGDFKFKLLRVDAVILDDLHDPADEIGLEKLDGGNVHGNLERKPRYARHAQQLAADGIEHKIPDIHDEAGLFGYRDELGG